MLCGVSYYPAFLTVKSKLGCSVQPIYSYCKNMEGLKQDVMEQVNGFGAEFF